MRPLGKWTAEITDTYLIVIGQVALTGAAFEAELDGKSVPSYTSIAVASGSVLKITTVSSCAIVTLITLHYKPRLALLPCIRASCSMFDVWKAGHWHSALSMSLSVQAREFNSSPTESYVIFLIVQPKGTGGARAYLAMSGGLDTPVYLGSRATFPGGGLGGVQVRYIASHIAEAI